MAAVELGAEAAPEIADVVEGTGGGGGLLKDFNDSPVGKVLGSSLGRAVIGHAIGGDIAGHVERAGQQPLGGGGGSTSLSGQAYGDSI